MLLITTRSMYHSKPDSNKRHIQHRSLRSWTLHERKTHQKRFIITRWCWSSHPKLVSSRESACQHTTSSNPTALNTQSTMIIRPTTRNPYWETLDEGFYLNRTAKTTMDKEDASYQNKGKLSGFLKIWCHEDPGQLDDHRKQTNRWWPDPRLHHQNKRQKYVNTSH